MFAVRVLSVCAGLVAWEAAGRWAGLRFLPPFSRVLAAATEMLASGQILPHLGTSLLSLLAGFALAAALGLALGALMGRSPTVDCVASPYVNAMLAAPKLVLVPVLYTLFGLSRFLQVAVIFLGAFFVVTATTARAVRSVDPALAEMARAFGASEREVLAKVLLPGALPIAMAGLRLGLEHGIKAMVAGEMFVRVIGLGMLLRTYGGRFDSERVFAILLTVVCVALACSSALRVVERRLSGWVEREA